MKIDGVAVAGVGMMRFGRYPDRSGADLAREAGLAALHDAGMTLADVDEAFVGYMQPAAMIGIKAMKELGLTGLPVTHIENASATGLVAFREAAWAVASGRAEVAMAIGFDKMTEMARGNARSRGTGRDELDSTILPAAYFALWAQRRMHDYGTTAETFAAIAAKNWNHGALCPWSDRQPDHTITVDEVMASRMIVDPAHSDDGVSGRRRRRLHHPGVDRVGAGPPAGPQDRAARRVDAPQRELLAGAHVPRAGRRAGDDDARRRRTSPTRRPGSARTTSTWPCATTPSPTRSSSTTSCSGFCAEGEGDQLVAKGETALGGRIPFNTDGGLIARGHPAGPTGLAMVHEVVQQLRHEAGPRQVEGARTALAHLVGGGSICTVSLFESD